MHGTVIKKCCRELPQSRRIYSRIQSSAANLCLLKQKSCVTHNLDSRGLAPWIHVAPLKSLLRGSALTLSMFLVKLFIMQHPAHAAGAGSNCMCIREGKCMPEYMHGCKGRVTEFLSILEGGVEGDNDHSKKKKSQESIFRKLFEIALYHKK